MTFKIAKSQMPEGFEAQVALHALEMRNWRSHMARVEEDKLKADIDPIKRHVAYKRPASHPLVEAAVNHDDVADYEIVDDGPTSDQILAAKKNALFGEVSRSEQNAINSVVPIGKRRLFNLQENDIRTADGDRARNVSLLTKVASSVGFSEWADVIEKARPAEDTKHIADQAQRRELIGKIERAAAQMYHDIEDLTIENVDVWKLPDFPK